MPVSREIWSGIVDTLPLAIAVIPWGILTGALAVNVGLTPLQAQAMSLLVFAGAAQLSVSTLLANGAGVSTILSSVFVISSRHLLYSMLLRQHIMQLPVVHRIVVGFLLTDEMFAVTQARTIKTGYFSIAHALASGIAFYLIWNLSTLLGIIAGDAVKNLQLLGLDFAIVATFIAMTFGNLRIKKGERAILVAVIVSGITAVLSRPILPDGYIMLAALLGMLCAYWCESEPIDSLAEDRVAEGEHV